MPEEKKQLAVAIPEALRRKVLVLLDRLPRGEVNETAVALEMAPTITVMEPPSAKEQ